MPSPDLAFALTSADVKRTPDGSLTADLRTTAGEVRCLMLASEGAAGAAVLLSGAGGGFDGPADGLYPRLALRLIGAGIASVRVGYRVPGSFEECVLDALAALAFLKTLGCASDVVVGHSFGGAVAIRAGELSPAVAAVAALSSQRSGTETVAKLAPRPLLLVHGTADTVLPSMVSADIYLRAGQPKRLALLEGGGHDLVEHRDQLTDMLVEFIVGMVGPRPVGVQE